MEKSEIERKEKTVRQRIVRTKDKDLVKTKVTELRETQKSENQTEAMVKSCITQLVAHYRANGKKAVNYFKFVIDPNNFGDTVENIFHVSFLVKEKKVI